MMTELKENNSAAVAAVASSSNRKKKQTKETLLKETSIHCSKGCTEWKAGNTEMALQEFIQALYIMESNFSLSSLHSLMAKTYFWIGFILQKSGSIDYEKCLEAFTMSFRIQIIMQQQQKQQQLLDSKNNNKKDDNNKTSAAAAAAAIEEAKRSVRWAYQKILGPTKDHHHSHLFVEALQRSVEYEQQGDILLLHSNKNDDTPVRSALEKYQQAVAALYDQHQVHPLPPPQLFAKIAAAKCHLASAAGAASASAGGNNDPKEEALLYYRKAVFGFWNSKIYPHHGHPRLNEMWEQIILLLPKQCDDDDDPEESSSLKKEVKEDYIQAATDSMEHQQKAQEQVNGYNNWTRSHYHLLQAIHSELKFCTPNHPIVIDLIQKIDIHILKMEAKFQVRIGREGIVAEALIFDGNKGDDDDDDAAARRRRRRLCQLERFYDRATKCLQILETISDQEEEKVQDQQQQQEEETIQTSSTNTWNSAQEENLWLERQIHLLELVYYIMSYNNNNSVQKKPNVKTQRINELTEELAMLSVSLMQVREKLSSDYYCYGNNAHRQQLVSNMATLHQKIAFREASLEMLQNNESKSSNKNHANESNNDVATDDAKHLLQSCLDEARIDCRINQQETKLLVEPIRMETKHESMPVAPAAAVATPAPANVAVAAVAPVEELSLEEYEWISSGSTTVSGSVLSEAEEIVRKSNECIAKLKLQIEEGGDLTSKGMVRREEIIMDSHKDAESQNMTNNNAHQNSSNAEGYCDVSKSENRSTAGNSPDGSRVRQVVVGVSAESGLKNNGGDVNNSMSDAIESTNNTFKSRTAIYTVGLDTNRRNNGGFHDELMFNDKELFDVTDPCTIPVAARISLDGSLLYLSGNSRVYHKLDGESSWRDLGCTDSRQEPFGWV